MTPNMTPELWMLVYSGVLLFVLILIPVIANAKAGNLQWAAGNRETPAPFPIAAWGGRGYRAYQNMAETLPIFIIAVLAAHLAGVSTHYTILGTQLYFGARVAHGLIYILGIKNLRSLAWLVSIIGIFMVLSQLCGTL